MDGQSNIVLKFGKYKNQNVVDIIKKDLGYCNWLISQPDFKEKNPIIFELMIYNGVLFDKDFTKKKELMLKRKGEYLTFGKYKDRKIVDIYNEDKNYCRYISTLPNVIKFHQPTVNTINELFETDL